LGFLASLFFLVFHPACNSREPLSQTAQIFRDRTLEDFDRLTPKLLPALASDSPVPAADAVIKAFLLHSHRNGCRMSGIGVLDKAGVYVTGYGFDDNNLGPPRRREYRDIKFGSFSGAKKIIESNQIIQAPLYFRNKKILVVGAPMLQKGNVLAIAYCYFEVKALEETWGITEEEFLQIDFNAR
jgi:hypothetical protein